MNENEVLTFKLSERISGVQSNKPTGCVLITPGPGAIKRTRAHFCSQSQFYEKNIYSGKMGLRSKMNLS